MRFYAGHRGGAADRLFVVVALPALVAVLTAPLWIGPLLLLLYFTQGQR